MKDNDWKKRLNIVYSTNPDFKYEEESEEPQTTLPPEKQKLRVKTDRRNRAGKTVTLVTGFTGNDNDLTELGKKLKTRCGTGGSVKDGEIIIQGDFKERVAAILKELGYTATKTV